MNRRTAAMTEKPSETVIRAWARLMTAQQLALASIERAGYVERRACDDDGRGQLIAITERGKAIRRIIRSVGAKLFFVPKYSPDLNPIEQAFAKIKHWMRAAQKRTTEDAWQHLGSLLASIQPHECSNYFANAGYASAKR